ncbi:MAG: hypothetical protein CME62_11940 [Halobacteriovoraceae bacterium]|nr:hypothetical protein [Halobacteriovoraceae bacterium]
MKTKKFFKVLSVLSSVMVLTTFSLHAIADDNAENRVKTLVERSPSADSRDERDDLNLEEHQEFLEQEKERQELAAEVEIPLLPQEEDSASLRSPTVDTIERADSDESLRNVANQENEALALDQEQIKKDLDVEIQESTEQVMQELAEENKRELDANIKEGMERMREELAAQQSAEEVAAEIVSEEETERTKPALSFETEPLEVPTITPEELAQAVGPLPDLSGETEQNNQNDEKVEEEKEDKLQVVLDTEPLVVPEISAEELAEAVGPLPDLSEYAKTSESSAASFEEPAEEVAESSEENLESEVARAGQNAEVLNEQAQNENLSEAEVEDISTAIEEQEAEVADLEAAVSETEVVSNDSEETNERVDNLESELAQAREDLEDAKKALERSEDKLKMSMSRSYKLEQVACRALTKNDELTASVESRIQEMMGPIMQNMQMMQQLMFLQRTVNHGYSSNNNSMFGLDYGYQMLQLDQLFKNQAMGGTTNNFFVGGDYIGGNLSNGLAQPAVQNDLLRQQMMMHSGQFNFNPNPMNPMSMMNNGMNGGMSMPMSNPNYLNPYSMNPMASMMGGSRFGAITPSASQAMSVSPVANFAFPTGPSNPAAVSGPAPAAAPQTKTSGLLE